MSQTRSIFGPVIILALLGLSTVLYLRINIDSLASKFARDKLTEFFDGSGFRATVNEANFIDGTGLELRGLRLFDTGGQNPIFAIDSILLRFPTEISDLVAGEVKPTSVEVRRAKLLVEQERLTPEFKQRLAALVNKHPQKELIPVRVRDSKLSYRAAGATKPIELNELAIDLLPEKIAGRKLQIAATAGGTIVRQMQVSGDVDLESKDWRFNLSPCNVDINHHTLSALPAQLRSYLEQVDDVHGKLIFTGVVASSENANQPKFLVKCKLADLSFQSQHFPARINDCDSVFVIGNERFQVERAQGRIGEGKFDIAYQQAGLLKRNSWSASGSVQRFEFDERFGNLFPEGCDRFCHDFSPSGEFDLQFAADSSGEKNVTAQITDMAFSFHRFPYPVQNCVGNVTWVNDNLDFNIQAFEKQQLLKFSGHVSNPGKQATYIFKFGTDGRLPIDQKLLDCLKPHPSMDRAFRDFRPNGFVSGHGTVVKKVPSSTVTQKDVHIDLHDCIVRHAKFEYPMQDVQGRIQVTEDGFQFNEITGRNGSGHAMCNGVWNPREGLRLVFKCDSVQLDNRLRNALSRNLQDVWDGFRPAGRVKLGTVFLDYPPGASFADVRIQATLGGESGAIQSDAVSVFPTWFPYRVSDLQGRVEIGSGVVTLQNVLGKHGKASFSCHGDGRYSNTEWGIRLTNLLARSVAPDDDFLHALPVDLADAIRVLDYQGQVNLIGEMTFAGSHANPQTVSDQTYDEIRQVSYQPADQQSPVDVGWDLRMDIDQGRMLVGLPLENIFGSVRLNGKSDGQISKCAGEVSIDSLTIYGTQITNIQGPIWIDNNQTLAGRFANGGDDGSDQDSPSLVGSVFDGKVAFDGWVSYEEKYPFFLQATVEKSQLEELATEIAPEMRELSGDAFGFLRLKGNANELHTYTGEGNIHLRSAKIHQLPVVLSLLKILNVKEVNRTAFDSSNVDFTVEGDQLKFDRIELIGDAISLIGNGYMELLRHADVNFYSVMGRNRIYIPLLSELYRAGSQRIMWINISGPLDRLQTSRKVLPGLDDSLKALIRGNTGSNGKPIQR